MAGSIQEIERLIIRLVGEGREYENMLKRAELQTKTYVDKAGRLHDKLTHKFVKGVAVMRLSLATLGKAMVMAGATMRSAGRTMSLAVTAPLMIVGGLAVRNFAKFDSAMTQSLAIMKTTADQAERMRSMTLDLSFSGDVLQAPTDLANAYFYLASAGKNAEQSMALLPQVAKFATAGMFDMALATDLLTDAQSALGLSSKNAAEDALNMARVSDVLVKANTLANATVEQFSIALTSKAGAALKAFNKDIEEGVAVLAALADQGVKAELAGNSLDRFLRLLSKSSLDNAKAHKRLGFEVFDASGKMRNMADIVGNLEDVLRGMSDQQRVATLDMLGFEARTQQVILPLIGTSKAIREYERELRKAMSITDEVARKQMKSFSGQMKIAWNQVKILTIDIGQLLSPALLTMGRMVKDAVETWKGWSSTTRVIIIALGVLTASISPLLLVFGSLAWAVGNLIALYTTLAAATWAYNFAMGGLALGAIVIAYVGIKAALAGVNDEYERSADLLDRTRKKQWDVITQMEEGAEKEAKVAKTNERLLREQNQARLNLSRAEAAANRRPSVSSMVKTQGVAGLVYAAERAGRATGLVDQFAVLRSEVTKAEKAVVDFGKTLEIVLEPPDAPTVGEKIKEDIESAKQSLVDFLHRLGRAKFPTGEKPEFTAMSGLGAMTQGIKQSFAGIQDSARRTFGEVSRIMRETWRKSAEEHLKSMEAQKKQMEDSLQQMQRGMHIAEQYFNPLESYYKTKLDLDKLLSIQAIDQETYDRAMKEADAELARLQEAGKIKIEFDFSGISVTKLGSAERVLRQLRSRVSRALRPEGPGGGIAGVPWDERDKARARVEAVTGKESPQAKIVAKLEELIAVAREQLEQERKRKAELEAANF